jgi:hypothetical protein
MSRATRGLLSWTVSALVILPLVAAAAEPEVRRAPPISPETVLRRYLDALDRHDLGGAKLIARQAAEQSPGPVAELMMRHIRLLAAAKSEQSAGNRLKQEPRGRKDNAHYTVTYNVADLVMPTQKLVLDENTPRGPKKPAAAEPPDFDGLIDLITGTVKPMTWEDVGEPGTIRPLATNLSVVVSQTEDVHKEIVALLEQLRRLQEITVMVDTRVVFVPGDVVPAGGQEEIGEWPGLAYIAGQSKERPNMLRSTLDAQQLKLLLDVAGKNGGRVTPVRRFTAFNGQMAEMSLPAENGKTHRAEIQAIVSNDQRRVRLTVTLDQKAVIYGSIGDGKTLPIDLPPLDEKPGKSGRASADAKAKATRRLLLVTPRIIIAEEEEERLGVAPASRN